MPAANAVPMERNVMDDPVQAQVDAYNARDIEAFVAAYAPDVVITDANGSPMLGGHDAMREQYGALFEGSPDLDAEILGRVSAGAWTVDQERVSRGDETRDVLVAYQVTDGLIARVVMLG
jgi:hypothetical protein